MTVEVSPRPRPQDISQLEAAYLMHRLECLRCAPEGSCELAQRLEEAQREAGAS